MQDYEYYDDYAANDNTETQAAARSRRGADNSVAAGEFITYEICVRLVAEISAAVFTAPHRPPHPPPSVFPDVCFGFFTLCVLCSHSVHRNLSGMAIADITLLSGFEVETKDLDRVSGCL